ncbi:hypothetical protein GC197_01780 [bacterium]|nr:hypothetical protein [bacterium]
MAQFWKDSDHLLWTLILYYAGAMIVASGPAETICPTAPQPATLLDYAWLAEGDLPEETRLKAQQRLQGHLAWMEDNLPVRWGSYGMIQRGEWVFQTMHDRLLTGTYDENQNALSAALLEGNYNCVSATILYQILADRAGLPTMAMQTRGHVWCRLLSRPDLDIETTCPTWFLLEPHDRDQSPASSAGSEAQTLSPRGLAAKIPYNQASMAAATLDYPLAIQRLDFALKLDPSDAAANRNRTAILNNWAVACVSQHQCDQALEILQQVSRGSEDDEQLAENREKIINAVVEQWCRASRFQDAIRLLQTQPSEGSDLHRLGLIYQRWLADASERGQWTEVKNVLRDALADLSDDALTLARLRRQYRQHLPG